MTEWAWLSAAAWAWPGDAVWAWPGDGSSHLGLSPASCEPQFGFESFILSGYCSNNPFVLASCDPPTKHKVALISQIKGYRR